MVVCDNLKAGVTVAAVIERTLRTTPVDATHWSIRSMTWAASVGACHYDQCLTVLACAPFSPVSSV